MALPVRQQATYWGIAAAVFLLVLWGLGSVILPFVVGGALAYLLDPVADRLERMGLSRTAATATTMKRKRKLVAMIRRIMIEVSPQFLASGRCQ